MSKIKKSYYKVMAKASCALFAFASFLSVQKDEIAKASDMSWLKNNNNDMFGELTSTVKSGGASLYNLLMVVSAVVVVGALIIAGLQYASTKNSTQKSETKNWIIGICLACVLIFGALFFVSLFSRIGSNLGSGTAVTSTP